MRISAAVGAVFECPCWEVMDSNSMSKRSGVVQKFLRVKDSLGTSFEPAEIVDQRLVRYQSHEPSLWSAHLLRPGAVFVFQSPGQRVPTNSNDEAKHVWTYPRPLKLASANRGNTVWRQSEGHITVFQQKRFGRKSGFDRLSDDKALFFQHLLSSLNLVIHAMKSHPTGQR